jgi:fumarylacetoacetase
VFKPKSGGNARIGVAIGDMVLSLSSLQEAGLMKTTSFDIGDIFSNSSINQFFSLGRKAWVEVRSLIQNLLKADNPVLRDNDTLRSWALLPIKDIEMLLPVSIGDYTDFYSSKEHATNVGIMFRGKNNTLQPNWVHLQVAYHKHSSSIVISGTDIRHPKSQIKSADKTFPDYAASRLLDFELEMGFFIGTGNKLGEPIPIEKAMDHIFGMVLVNDWSARDIQRWEYVPLGPFLGKNFASLGMI